MTPPLLRLYNSLGRTKQDFSPVKDNHVGMYVCGPTVYDHAHIGNARPVVVFDVLYRLLGTLYDSVTYVRNITDIDDKIITTAKKRGETLEALTARTTEVFHADMAALGALPPTVEPRATHHIPDMLAMISTLVDKGYAYAVRGHVLCHVPAVPDYGRLSGRTRAQMIAGARVEVSPDKKDAADFVLWKPSAPDQPGWDSPWGRGRPGWHIECSAMSAAHLGPCFDIHGGGLDLMFPHHENERAQSCCAHGTDDMARFWLHNGYVTMEGEKMSKSLGNIVTVHALLGRGWPGEVIRLALLSAHYRQPLAFSEERLAASRAQLDRFYGALRHGESSAAHGDRSVDHAFIKDNAPASLWRALLDDLNVPAAVRALSDVARRLNKSGRGADELRAGGALLGLLSESPAAWFARPPAQSLTVTQPPTSVESPLESQPAGSQTVDAAWIEDQIAARLVARRAGDYKQADAVRADLEARGIVLEDGADKTTWRWKSS